MTFLFVYLNILTTVSEEKELFENVTPLTTLQFKFPYYPWHKAHTLFCSILISIESQTICS